MISVILYGRNDAHGYNLHRRAALSLNCIAEVLDDADDEIIFVDYNTPDELPTFIEALSDTLTERCLGLLQVLRVPAAIHKRRFAARTHLAVAEPVARNAAVRRSNPANRWLLSTNTDMILLPLSERSLSETCSDLADGFYALPRFELPEWLWEGLPRSDPARALGEIQRLGPALRLDEPTVSHEWILFDAPGDFQLILRDDFFAIDGFDEEMLVGYHVDSNLSRRMFLHRGSIASLGELVAGYHCNHNRTPTVYHGARVVMNDLDRFFYSVARKELPSQRKTWGLAGVSLEEVPVRERVHNHFAASVMAAIPEGADPCTSSDAVGAAYALTYDSGHVLPFVADSLVVSRQDVTVAYLGVNPVLERMLATLVAKSGRDRTLAAAELENASSVDQILHTANVFVVDLGTDASLVDGAPTLDRGYESLRLPERLDLVFAALRRLAEVERSRLELGEHPRRIVLINSSTVFWDAYVTAELDCSYTTPHSRVRRATVRPVPDDDDDTRAAVARADRLIAWSTRKSDEARERLELPLGKTVSLAELSNFSGFGRGWTYPEDAGVWTLGPRSELAISVRRIPKRSYKLAFAVRAVCVGADEPLRVELLTNRSRVATRSWTHDSAIDTWEVDLPAHVLTDGRLDLTLVIEEPRSPLALGWSSDERRLGILIQSVAFEKVRRSPWLRRALHQVIPYLRAKIGFRRHFRRLWRRLRQPTAAGF